MGTFHSDSGPLHGITVVIDTHGSRIYIGRCHEERGDDVVLLDVDAHEDGADGCTKEQYVRRAARLGVWKRWDRVTVPRKEIASIRRLGDVLPDTT